MPDPAPDIPAHILPAVERCVPFAPFPVWEQVHEWHELQLPLEGSYRARLADGTVVGCEPGAGLLLPAGTVHTPLLRVGDPVVFFCCMWRDPDAAPALGTVDDADGRLLFCCDWMWRLCAPHPPGAPRPAAVDRRLRHLMTLLVDLVAGTDEADAALGDRKVARVIDHLRVNLAEPNRIRDLAALVGMSADGLIRRFRAATGTTPGRYLQELRLVRAQALLAASDLPVSAIAARVGYAGASHLSNLLRRRTGRRPGELR